jgi:hypothetical protein
LKLPVPKTLTASSATSIRTMIDGGDLGGLTCYDGNHEPHTELRKYRL